MALNIISINVRGMRDPVKRREVFEFYRKRGNILCIQETHCTPEEEKIWKSEWGGEVIFSHGNSTSRGVAIFFHRDLKKVIKIEEYEEWVPGRVVACVISYHETRICIVCIYGPNEDSPGFFEKIMNSTHEMCEKVAIVGDFNTCLNYQLDRKQTGQKTQRNSNAANKINSIMSDLVMCEIWRVRNPTNKRYSWYRGRGKKLQASRIDFAVISVGLSKDVHNCFYLNGIRTDHSAFFIGIEVNKIDRGTGLLEAKYVHASQRRLPGVD